MLFKRQRAETVSHNKTRQVAEMTKVASPSHPRLLAVRMDAAGFAVAKRLDGAKSGALPIENLGKIGSPLAPPGAPVIV